MSIPKTAALYFTPWALALIAALTDPWSGETDANAWSGIAYATVAAFLSSAVLFRAITRI